MSNHLIIGLGGTGGKVIRNLRKTIYRDCRDTSPSGIRLDYLYVDSSPEHMNPVDPDWKVLGQNLQLNPPSQILLQGSDLAAKLGDIHSYPSIAPWIGEPRDWNSILNLGSGAKVLGGQKRRLGRFLFAGQATEFENRLNSKINDLTANGAARVAIHVVSGLAGGTGSGCLIDAITILRNSRPDSKRFPIILYLLLPDENPLQNWDTGNYHANGYAALTELNALSVGDYKPHSLTGRGERVTNLNEPFKICYLVTDHNSNGMRFSVDKEIPDLIAELLYQKLVAEARGLDAQVGRIQEWENLEITHEGSKQNGFPKPERSRLFASFGIKKILYPEEEIRDYIGYSLTRQTLLQLLYNNWSQGFLAEAADVAAAGFVSLPETQAKFNLDPSTYFLEKRFSDSEHDLDQSHWAPLATEWKNFINGVAADTVENSGGNWLSDLRRHCEDRFKSRFRAEKGVADYYKWKEDRLSDYSRQICGKLEALLCDDLLEGRRSMTETEAILYACDQMLAKQEEDLKSNQEKLAAKVAKEKIRWMENMQRFEDMGPLARRVPGRKENIFEAGKIAMEEYFAGSSRMAAWEFAQLLLRAVRRELLANFDQVKSSMATMKGLVAACEESIRNHTPEESTAESEKVCIRLYNGDEVTRYVNALIANREFQDIQARNARTQLLGQVMVGQKTLRNLPTEKDKTNVQDILAKSSHETLKTYDSNATIESSSRVAFDKILSVSIIDKLEKRYNGDDDKMRTELREFLAKAGDLLPRNEAEHHKKGVGTEFSSQNLKTNLIILMPNPDATEGFAYKLRNTLRESVPNGDPVIFINNGESRKHEIAILKFVQLFPLRYVDVLTTLKQKYEARLLDGDRRRRLLEVHTDRTESGEADFPLLFVPSVADQAGPALLLGMHLGTVRPKNTPGVAAQGWHGPLVMVKDEFDNENLGNGIDGALGRLANADQLESLQALNAHELLSRTREGDAEIEIKLGELIKEIAAGDDDRLRSLARHREKACKEVQQIRKFATT